MGRNRGFTAALVQIQRETERRARAEAAARTRAAREADRTQKAYERAQTADLKERQRLYVESRAAFVDLMNEKLNAQVARLETLLMETLDIDDFLDFDALKEAAPLPVFTPWPVGGRPPTARSQ